MIKEIISSTDNPKIKLIKKLLTKPSFRKKEKLFVLEGKRFICDVIKHNPQSIVFLAICTTEKDINLAKSVSSDQIYYVDNKVFGKISNLATAPGILAVIKQPFWKPEQLIKPAKKIVILDNVQNPANLGAVIRNCIAFNCDVVLHTPGTVDPFHPESLRGMAGNYYQIPILELTPKIESSLIEKNTSIFALDPKAKNTIEKIKLNNRNIFVFGSEGRGIITKKLFTKLQAQKIKIEINPRIDSLNIAVCSGIVLFKINRLGITL